MSKLKWTKRSRIAVSVLCVALATAGLVIFSQVNQFAEAAILEPIGPQILEPIFHDDFSNDLSNWTIKSGSWAIESEELSQSVVDGSYLRGKIMINDLDPLNLVIEARMKYIELYPNTMNYMGFAVRYIDDNIFYWIVFQQKSDALGLPASNLKLELRAQFDIIEMLDLGFMGELNHFYTLKVEVLANNFKIYVDDVLKIDSTDTTFQNAGSILAWTGRCQAHFDDVSVSAANVPSNYKINVRAGATQTVVTCAWSGSGNITIELESPTTTYYETNMTIYEKTTISGSKVFNIKRAALYIEGTTSPQTWTLYLSLSNVATYQASVEIS